MKKIVLAVIFCIVLIGCAEDKGNYNYKDLNDITITLKPVTEDGSGSDVMHDQQYKITPELKRLLSASEEGLSFEWTVGSEVVSKERNLDIIVPKKWSFGAKNGRLAITDSKTGMKYFAPFKFNLINSFGFGYYMLCKKSDNSSILYYLKEVEDKTADVVVIKEPVIASTSMIGDLEFGKEPTDMVNSYGYNANIDDDVWDLNIMTKEGKYNMIKTNTGDFLPSQYVGAESFADKSKGYKFNPSAIGVTGRSDIMYLSNGQLITQIEDMLYRPSKLYPEYNFTKLYIGNPSMTYFAYDDNTSKFYYLAQDNDISAYDAVEVPEGAPSYSGKNIIGFAFDSYSNPDYSKSEEYIYCAVASNNEISIDKYTYSEEYGDQDVTKKIFCSELYKLSVPDVGEKSKILLFNKDWYISGGNTVYLSPFDIPNAQPLYKVPAEYGEIKDMQLSVKGTKLVIACYNSNSSEEKKGSLIVFDLQTKKANIHKYFMDETVVLNCCDDRLF